VPGLRQLTLNRFFAVALGGMALLLGALVVLFHAGSRTSVLATAERGLAQTSRHLVDRISRHLGQAEVAVSGIERRVQAGLVRPGDGQTVARMLLGELLENDALTELTVTHPAGQVSVYRGAEGVVLRTVDRQGSGWRARRGQLGANGIHAGPPGAPEVQTATEETGPVEDPTAHDTYRTPALPELRGRALWSDLSFAQQDRPDQGSPDDEGRRVVTVQKALWSADGLLGVLRVGLQSAEIDGLARVRVDRDPIPDPLRRSGSDPHQVFVCDRHGRLVTRLGPHDTFVLMDADGQPDPDGDVRVSARSLRADVRAALALPALAEIEPGRSLVQRLTGDDGSGGPTLVSFTALPPGRTVGWVVGVVVPEAHYLGELAAARRRLLGLAVLALLVAAGLGALALRAVGRDLAGLTAATSRLRSFDFSATPARAGGFQDLASVADGLEQAKIALRAMTRYVPLDLVKQLYQDRREPVLGGRLQDVSILFSDIEGFTTLSERMPPDQLAAALGKYLAVVTAAIHDSRGVVDKYTGDGVMALWNAPSSCPDHASAACQAALRCLEATEVLFASAEWAGLPPWRTRIGIHRAQVMVGHFGAPDRMSFTAMGDGVNLASRLEGLNKQYGTHVLVSGAVQQAAAARFRFRRVDRVTVKGKEESVEVYELVADRADLPADGEAEVATTAATPAFATKTGPISGRPG
jgi:adenylate cyclase